MQVFSFLNYYICFTQEADYFILLCLLHFKLSSIKNQTRTLPCLAATLNQKDFTNFMSSSILLILGLPFAFQHNFSKC